MNREFTAEELLRSLEEYFQNIMLGSLDFAAQQLANATNQVVQIHVHLIKTDLTVTIGPVEETTLQ